MKFTSFWQPQRSQTLSLQLLRVLSEEIKLKKLCKRKTQLENLNLKKLKTCREWSEIKALETWNLKAKTWFFFKNYDFKNLYQNLLKTSTIMTHIYMQSVNIIKDLNQLLKHWYSPNKVKQTRLGIRQNCLTWENSVLFEI